MCPPSGTDSGSTAGLKLFLSVADLTIQPRSLDWFRGPCLTGRRPSRYVLASLLFDIGFQSSLFYCQSIDTHLANVPPLSGLRTGAGCCSHAAPVAEL